MTNPAPDPTDERLRRAAAELRHQVAADTDTDAALATVLGSRPPRRSGRAPWAAAAAAAVLALVLGALVLVADRDGGEEVTIDDRRTPSSVPDAPDAPAVGAPHDGRASLDLPVTAEPSTDLHPGDAVTLAGEGFTPGRTVGIAQCTMDVTESSAGSAACDLGLLGTGSTPDAEGRATGSIAVRRVIQVGAEKVDCAADGVRCGVAMGQIDDYDVSGVAEITFADDLPPLVRPTVTVTPSTGLRHGDTVTISLDGLTGPVEGLQLCAVAEDDGPPGVSRLPAAGAEGHVPCWYGLAGDREPGPFEPDARGRVEVEVRLWRSFSPDGVTVVDCAEQQCAVFAFGGGDLDPAPAPVGFDPDEPALPRAQLDVDPATGLRAGDPVTVTVTGLDPGTAFVVSACGDLSGTGSVRHACGPSVTLSEGTAGADGSWVGSVEVPSPSEYGVDCSRAWACALTVTSGTLVDDGPGEVLFLPPEPVEIRFAG